MLRFGLDLGTKNIVLSFKDAEGKIKYRKEVNGFFKIPNDKQFAKNMLTQAGVPHIEYGSSFVALGSKAEELAYTFNKTLRRPMSDGVLSSGEEDSIEIMASIVQSLIGEIKDDGILYYCVPAKALNRNINVDFHQKVAQMIINGYASKTGKKLQGHAINEAHALVLASIPDKTGIGISFGAGMVNVSYCLFGIPVFNFSLVGSGDWIDIESAKQFGFDPTRPDGDYKHTPTSICKAKESTSLREMPSEPTKRAIYINYQILMESVINGIVKGFKDNEDKARVARPMPIVLAGGTSSPDGFIEMFKDQLTKAGPAFAVGDITRPEKPLFTVAEGCLIAAELHDIKETK